MYVVILPIVYNSKWNEFSHSLISMSSVSNAADKSQTRTPVMSPSSEFCIHSFYIEDIAVIVDRPRLKPCWLLGRILWTSTNLVNWSHRRRILFYSGIWHDKGDKVNKAWWHIGMLSASYWDPWQVPGSNPSKGEWFFMNSK